MSAVLERTWSEAEIIEGLTLLVSNSGNAIIASGILKKNGSTLNQQDLRLMREQNSGMYVALAADYARAVEDGIAQNFRETAAASSSLTHEFVRRIAAQVEEEGLPENPERLLMALTRVEQVATDKLLSITGRPVGGQATDPMEAARELVRLGVLKPVDVTEQAHDTTAEDDTDG